MGGVVLAGCAPGVGDVPDAAPFTCDETDAPDLSGGTVLELEHDEGIVLVRTG